MCDMDWIKEEGKKDSCLMNSQDYGELYDLPTRANSVREEGIADVFLAFSRYLIVLVVFDI